MPEQSTEEWGGGEEFYGEGNGAEPGETVMVVGEVVVKL